MHVNAPNRTAHRTEINAQFLFPKIDCVHLATDVVGPRGLSQASAESAYKSRYAHPHLKTTKRTAHECSSNIRVVALTLTSGSQRQNAFTKFKHALRLRFHDRAWSRARIDVDDTYGDDVARSMGFCARARVPSDAVEYTHEQTQTLPKKTGEEERQKHKNAHICANSSWTSTFF